MRKNIVKQIKGKKPDLEAILNKDNTGQRPQTKELKMATPIYRQCSKCEKHFPENDILSAVC